MEYAWSHPEYFTVTCLEWKLVIEDDRFKEIVIESLRFLTKESRIQIFGFVLMSNHFHLIWQMLGNHKRRDVQRDFLKYTGQRILKKLREENSILVDELHVGTTDRKYQVWERNSLGVSLTTKRFTIQKLNYIHNNPVRAGLCKYPEEYKYSSARFYICNERDWDFLSHYDG